MCNFEPYILLKSVYFPVIRLVVRFTFRQARNALFFFSIFDIIGISKNSRISVKDESLKIFCLCFKASVLGILFPMIYLGKFSWCFEDLVTCSF